MGATVRWWRGGVALACTLLFLLPLVVMVSGSLRPAGSPPPRTPELVPDDPTLANYADAFDQADLAHQALNSSVVVAVVVPMTIVVASWTGLAIRRLPGRAGRLLAGLALTALMVPTTALLVGRLTFFSWLGLTDTLVPLMSPALVAVSPFFVLLYGWSFGRIGDEQIDAARLEGAGWLMVWRRVLMPQVRPTTAAVAALAFALTWGNFLDPLIYLSDPDRYTLPLGLRSLAQLDPPDAPIYLAAAVVATVPVLVALAVTQRSFLRDPDGS
jgi:multiple sugar transport system permease protein